MRRALCLRACVTASPVAGEGRPEGRGRVEAPSGRIARRGRTAVKPPTPLTGPSRRAKARSGRGGAESEASGPKAATLGKHVCARAPGWPDVCGRWCDGQRTKEQRGARTPAHAKVGGAMILAGQACCRFSRFIRPIPLRPLGWVRCPSLAQRKREHAAGGVLRGGCRAAPCWRVSEPWNRTAAESVAGGTE